MVVSLSRILDLSSHKVFVSILIPHLLIGLLPFALALAALQVESTNNQNHSHKDYISGVLQQEQMSGEATYTDKQFGDGSHKMEWKTSVSLLQ